MKKNLIIITVLPLAVLLLGLTLNLNMSDPLPVKTVHGMNLNQARQLLFQSAGKCMSCHNNLVTPSGENVSFGIDWRTSMMANSARDPYWHAAVRREVTDHPESQALIENECSTCHMPMAHYQVSSNGEMAKVFANLPANQAVTQQNMLAIDGVSCTTCHQITGENFGEKESFVGNFGIDKLTPMGERKIYGPYPVDVGRSTIMHSSSGFRQAQSKHIQQSELCATCHTLYTHTLGPDGEVIGELPEQVPYLEWKNSSFVDEQSCQSCHMPVVKDSMPISSVWGQPRAELSRHSFRGGNFFMLSMLNRYRDELGVLALPQEMDAAINRTINHLQTKSSRVFIEKAEINESELLVALAVQNLAGHKLPTAYPSRRVWIHFKVQDANGNTVFESGAVNTDGSITGNDNDREANAYEPHYADITNEEQVQIYEAILADQHDEVTTGLLTGIRFIKDNRILPRGFDKATADEDIAVQGSAYKDGDFIGGMDTVTYRIPVEEPFSSHTVTAELIYQPIAYRWAQNLDTYDTPETNSFVQYYDSMSDNSSVVLASTTLTVE
ncbi:hypothetical protein G3570_07950 [Balneolaceae bacterium YR4-1]|uniref:Uncharacterized protein n=1 Tax=Halalkalibaculum roseum TaxID=2709311 RepID=A0A6M1SMK9_9BACT|nr:hypothetical protein [Halalkalibaculum roseum]NGP76561.1 hypothetical protein [Halalkalibaculum roseum]